MRTIRIYQQTDFIPHTELVLCEQAAHHVRTVLRLKEGQALQLFNGENQQCNAVIEGITKKQVIVVLQSIETLSLESPLSIHLGQAIIKGERMEWLIQKSVELGVHCITPLIAQYCSIKMDKARLNKKVQQWQAIAISACEQCGRNYIPRIYPPVSLPQFLLEQASAQQKIMLDPRAAQGFGDYDATSDAITLLIGPEGGFSAEEDALSQQQGFTRLALGPRVLRAESAALVSQTLLQGRQGDLYNNK